MTILTDKPEVDWIDAALLVEELAEIYNTPTPKGWREAEKSNFYWLIVLTIAELQYLYSEPKQNPTQIRVITTFGIKENIPNLR